MVSSPSPLPPPRALWRALIDGCQCMCRAAPGYEAHLVDDAGLVLTGEPHADMNFAFLGSPVDAARHWRAFHARAAARGLPMMVLGTTATTPHLTAEAAASGDVPAGDVPFMVCAEPQPGAIHHPYTIVRIDGPAALAEAVPLAARTFGLPTAPVARVYNPEALTVPGVDFFTARRAGALCSFVQTTRRGTHVGLWSMATPPEYQGQGAGRALLDAVLAHHRQRGAAVFYLMASSAGHTLYERAGFHETTRLAAWLNGASSQVGCP